MTRILDCRKKEILEIKRMGGDLAINVYNPHGFLLEEYWFEMKKPYAQTYKKIEKHFEAIKSLLERQKE